MIETLALLLGGAVLGAGLAGALLVRHHRQQRRDLLLTLPVPVAARDVHGELQWNAAADALLEGALMVALRQRELSDVSSAQSPAP